MGVEKPWPPSDRVLRRREESVAKKAGESEYGENKPCICPKEPKSPEQHQPPPQQPGSGQPEEPQDSYETCPLCNGTTPEPKPPYYYYEQPGDYITTIPDSGSCTECDPETGLWVTCEVPAATTTENSVVISSGQFIWRLPLMSLGALGAGTWGFGLNYLSGTPVDGILGKHFNFTQNSRLVIYDDGDVDLISAKNTLQRFLYNATTGKYSSELNNTRSQLTRRNVGTPNDEFVLISANGNTSVFFGVGATIKTPGRIKSLIDRYGNRQTFTWFATPTQVLLTSVTDSYGRTVEYRYYGSDLFFRLREIEDFTGRRINFQYDTFGRLVAVITPSVLRAAPGNTFEGGAAYVFQYDVTNRRPERRDDLIRIWYPNQATRFIDPASRTINVQEVYDAGETSLPRYTIAYGQDPTDVDQYGRVVAQTVGDPGGTVGGTYLFQYSSQWDDINIANPFTEPVNQIVSRTVVTDRNGNQTEWHFNGNSMPVRKRVIATRNKNSLQGPDYITWTKYSARNQPLVVIFPEGNSITNEYDDGQVTGIGFFAPKMGQLQSTKRELGNDYGIPVSSGRSQPSNGQTELARRYFYEPIFSGICATIEERGNPINHDSPPDNYFDPQNGTGAGFPKPDDEDRSRYATITYRDYQKNTDATITNDAALQTLLGLNATQIQALIDHVDDQMKATDGTGGLPAGFERNLGDDNGDGTGNGDSSGLPAARQRGDIVKIKHPAVLKIGSTTTEGQDRIELFTTNDRGQTTTHTDPEGNVTAFVRYPLADPDGEGVFQDGNSTDPNFATKQFQQYGRMKEVHVDIDPNDVMSLIGERGDLVDFVPTIARTNTPDVYQDLVTRYEGTSLGGGCSSCAYDPLGNPLAVTNARGFTTHYDRNELGEAFRVTSPEPYNYQTETYFDANRNVVRVDIEDRVVQYDSDDPSAAGYAHFTPTGGGSTAHVPTKAGPGGLVRPGWFTNLFTFDLLDNVVQQDIDATGANPANLITSYEYDANENRTEVLKPEGNTVEFDYDERDLLIATRVGYDPDAATDESATTVNVYDKNGNLLNVIGPAQRGGAGTSLSVIIEDAFGLGETIIHSGDWLVENTYDGFDRVIKSTDAVGNVANNLYDPGRRIVKADREGPIGGTTPTDRIGTANVKLAEAEMRYDEAGRQYESQQNVFLADGTTLPSARAITHTGGGLAANSNANNHVGTATLTMGEDSYVLTRTVFDRASRAVEFIGDLVKPTNLLSMTSLEYDGAGRRIATEDALGNRVEFSYDAGGNVIGIVRTELCTISQDPAIDAESFTSAMRYDSLDRLVIQANQGPDGVLDANLAAANNQTLFARFGYDSRSNRTLLVDPKGNSSITSLDGASRPFQTSQHLRDKGQGENPPINNQTFLPGSGATVLTTSVLDGNSRVTQLIDDRGNVTEFDYDSLDRQIVMTFQDGSTRTSVYDRASDVETYADENGSIFDSAFDPIGRRTACAISPAAGVIGTTSQSFQYDGLSRLTSAQDFVDATSVSVTLRYDSLGRVLEDSQTVGGNRRDVTNAAFTSYPMTTFTFPQGRQLTNEYDLLYRRTNVNETTGGANIAAWQFFGPGRVAEVQLGPADDSNLYCTFMNNARTHSAVQDSVPNPGWGTPGDDRLGYDGAGRMIAKRFLFTELTEGGAYETTTPKVGFTTSFDAASNKLYERELHAESRSHLYQPFTTANLPANGGYDSLDRLRSYQRGNLSSTIGLNGEGGGAVTTPIAVLNTKTEQTYDLDGLGNWKKTVFKAAVSGTESIENRRHNGLNQTTKLSIVGDDPPEPSIQFYPGRQTGELTQVDFKECSDVAASRRNKGVLWIIVDQTSGTPFAGEAAHLFAIDPQGRLLQTFTLKDEQGNALAVVDLECLGFGPGPNPSLGYLYLGDTGTSTARTPTSNPTRLFRLPEPDVTGTADAPTTATLTAEVLVYRYFGQGDTDPAPNAETLLVDPASGTQYIGTKENFKVRLYEVAPSDWTATTPPTLPLTVDINTSGGSNPDLDMATGGSISADGTLIAIRSEVKAYAWKRAPGLPFVNAFNDAGNPPIDIDVPGPPGEPEGEGLAFDDRGGYFTTSEFVPGTNAGPIYYYQRRGEALSYDPAGNLLFDGQRVYEWDALNRLVNVYRLPASGIDLVPIANYSYDAFGRRVNKTVLNGGLPGTLTNVDLDFVYSGWRCIEDRDMAGDANTPYRQYVWGIYLDELLQLKVLASLGINGFPDDAYLYPLQDLLYRTTGLATASDGIVREAYDTDAYGNTLIFREADPMITPIDFANDDPQVLAATCDFIFTGQRYDAETQLYNYRTRYYSPTLGRFISKDMVFLNTSRSLYQYVISQPSKFLDPSGLLLCLCKCKDGQAPANDAVNKLFNDTLKEAAGKAGATHDTLLDAIKNNMIKGSRLYTGFELNLRKELGKDKETADKYLVKCGTITKPSAPAIVIECNGKRYCIGTDKLGHFLEEGLIYHTIKHNMKLPAGKGQAYAEAWGEWSEGQVPKAMDKEMWNFLHNTTFKFFLSTGEDERIGGDPGKSSGQDWYGHFGDSDPFRGSLDPNGVVSPADLAANVSGLQFYEKLLASPVGDFKFDICDFINEKWDHLKNKNAAGDSREVAPPKAPLK